MYRVDEWLLGFSCGVLWFFFKGRLEVWSAMVVHLVLFECHLLSHPGMAPLQLKKEKGNS